VGETDRKKRKRGISFQEKRKEMETTFSIQSEEPVLQQNRSTRAKTCSGFRTMFHSGTAAGASLAKR